MTPEFPPAEPKPLLPVGTADVAQLAVFLRALGDPTRLRLLAYLMTDEHTVTECVAHVHSSQSRVSHHLAHLASCDLVLVRRRGRFRHYRIADQRVADLIQLAVMLAADNASGLATCTRVIPVVS